MKGGTDEDFTCRVLKSVPFSVGAGGLNEGDFRCFSPFRLTLAVAKRGIRHQHSTGVNTSSRLHGLGVGTGRRPWELLPLPLPALEPGTPEPARPACG